MFSKIIKYINDIEIYIKKTIFLLPYLLYIVDIRLSVKHIIPVNNL